MNDYVLSTDDYMYFYPYVMPREIKEEFGSYSIIARNIQKLYKKHGLISADDALDMIIERSYAIADLDISHEVWHDYVVTEIARIRRQKIQVIHDKINTYRHIKELLK